MSSRNSTSLSSLPSDDRSRTMSPDSSFTSTETHRASDTSSVNDHVFGPKPGLTPMLSKILDQRRKYKPDSDPKRKRSTADVGKDPKRPRVTAASQPRLPPGPHSIKTMIDLYHPGYLDRFRLAKSLNLILSRITVLRWGKSVKQHLAEPSGNVGTTYSGLSSLLNSQGPLGIASLHRPRVPPGNPLHDRGVNQNVGYQSSQSGMAFPLQFQHERPWYGSMSTQIDRATLLRIKAETAVLEAQARLLAAGSSAAAAAAAAQAIADHPTIKMLSESMDELVARQDSLTRDVSDVKDKLATLSTGFSEVQQIVSHLDERQGVMIEDMGEMEDIQQDLSDDLKVVRIAVKKAEEDIRVGRRTMAAITKKDNPGELKQLKQEVAELNMSVGDIQEQVWVNSAEVHDTQVSVMSLETRVDQISGRTSIIENLNENDYSIDIMQMEVKSHESSIERISAEVKEIKAKKPEHELMMQCMSERNEALRKCSEMEDVIKSSRISAIDREVLMGSLQSQTVGYESQINDLQAQLRVLDHEVTELRLKSGDNA